MKFKDKLGLSCAKLRTNLVWLSLVWYKFSQKISLGKKMVKNNWLRKTWVKKIWEKNLGKKKFE